MHRVYRLVGPHRFFSNVRLASCFFASLRLLLPHFLVCVFFAFLILCSPHGPQQTRRKFLDKVRINVKAGDGGDGCASFERTIHGIGTSAGIFVAAPLRSSRPAQ